MKICRTTATALALFATLSLPLYAQSPPAASLAAGKVVLPEGTEVKLTLEKSLKSGAEKVDEEVPYEVARDVYSPFPAHVLLIPAGTPAFGKVTRSSRRGMLGKGGKLEFTCDYVRALDGTHVPLRADKTTASGRSNAGANVAAVLLFAPSFLINGRDISVNKGKEVIAYVDQETLLTNPQQGGMGVQSAPPAALTPVTAPASPSSQTLFTLKDGSQVVGSLASFDGANYVVATASGNQTISAANVAAMHALSASAPAPPAAAATPAAPPVPAPPRLPVIKTFPQRVRIETNDGNSYFGNVTAFDGTIYSVTTSGGALSVKQSDVKMLTLL